MTERPDKAALIRERASQLAIEQRVLEQQLGRFAPGDWRHTLGVEPPRADAYDLGDETGRAEFRYEFERRRRDWLLARWEEHSARQQRHQVRADRAQRGVARFADATRGELEALLDAAQAQVTWRRGGEPQPRSTGDG